MSVKDNGKNRLKALLSEILEAHAQTRVNGNVASHSTATTNGSNLHRRF
jgi:hypothetical protein